jgi:hypothetical protein
MAQPSTLEVQELIYKRRVRRLEMRKGRNLGDIIGRINARPARTRGLFGEKLEKPDPLGDQQVTKPKKV